MTDIPAQLVPEIQIKTRALHIASDKKTCADILDPATKEINGLVE